MTSQTKAKFALDNLRHRRGFFLRYFEGRASGKCKGEIKSIICLKRY